MSTHDSRLSVDGHHHRMWKCASVLAGVAALFAACSDEGSTPAASPDDAGAESTDAADGADASSNDEVPAADAGGVDSGPPRRPLHVDTTAPKRSDFTFTAKVADPAASLALGTQGASLDTRVKPVGKLVVFLHGSGATAPTTCVNTEMATLLTQKGFHVFMPCYDAYYGVGNCGADIGGCRKEAFEGKDYTSVIDVKPPDAIEPRVIAALKHLTKLHPAGDWSFYLQGESLYWPDIVIAGHSHGAATSGLVGMIRPVDRVVMLSGPDDRGQAWLSGTSITSLDRFYGFANTADGQYPGMVAAYEALKVPGAMTTVDGAQPPYGNSHRLSTSATTAANAHGSTEPGPSSPKVGSKYVFEPVWKVLFGR